MNEVTPVTTRAGREQRGRRPAASVPPRYWAFLSYAHRDAKAASRLHRLLEQYRVPAALVGKPHPLESIPPRLTPIFRDRQELAASADLSAEIGEALAGSRYLIVLCSPAAANSRWVDQEVRDFKRLHGEDRVLAAIVAGEPFASERPGEEAAECFPPSMRQRIDDQGRPTGERTEPIAADLRDEADGWRHGSLKIVAGMLDVGLDELVQREQQRRQRRMAWIMTASLAGMAMTTGLSVVAINARDAARDERRQAEGLVGFMLGDLKSELEPIGRLDALDKVGERALAYYARQDKRDLTDEALAQRSRALTLLGQIATARGDIDGANARIREALRGTGELVARAPDDPQRLFDHAQNVFYLGELARQRGRLDEAERAYRDYQRLARQMVAVEPTNPRWQMESFYAKENVGIVLYAKRRFSAAAAEFQDAVARMRALTLANPSDATYPVELSNILAWLGDAQRDEGRLDRAIATREAGIAFLRHMLERDPTNTRLRQRLVPALQALGILLRNTGKVEPAIDRLREALDEARTLATIEPGNLAWSKGMAAGIHLELAETLIAAKRLNDAEEPLDAGCALTEMLRRKSPDAANWRSFLSLCGLARARMALARNNLPQALALVQRAVIWAGQEAPVDPYRNRYARASALLLSGDVRRRMGDRGLALADWRTGAALLPVDVAERPREMRLRADLMQRLGRWREERALLERLARMGFQERS